MANCFFTSDTHFGHGRIIKYCNRPFMDADEMDATLVTNWNSVVNSEDVVYHLGDFSFHKDMQKTASIRRRLNGSICLVRGNHDRQYPSNLFEWIKDYYELWVGNQEIVLFHYGMRTWHHDIRGTWHLYGHSHNGLPAYGKSFDVGVDCWNFTPLSFDQVKAEMDKRTIGSHPQFSEFVAEASRCGETGLSIPS